MHLCRSVTLEHFIMAITLSSLVSQTQSYLRIEGRWAPKTMSCQSCFHFEAHSSQDFVTSLHVCILSLYYCSVSLSWTSHSSLPFKLVAPMEGYRHCGLLCTSRISLQDADILKFAAHERPHDTSPAMSQLLAISSRQDRWSARSSPSQHSQ